MTGRLNIEIKARCKDTSRIRKILTERKAGFIGLDKQTDTYFNTRNGRLKLREGNIENGLMHYERDNKSGPKESNYILYKTAPGNNIKEALTRALGILAVVEKEREIYYIENIKFHLDEVKGLGNFVEIEATDDGGKVKEEILYEQCRSYMKLFGIEEQDLISKSYSDMVIEMTSPGN
jgi:predicted adenylyl cyclase CyaB